MPVQLSVLLVFIQKHFVSRHFFSHAKLIHVQSLLQYRIFVHNQYVVIIIGCTDLGERWLPHPVYVIVVLNLYKRGKVDDFATKYWCFLQLYP